MTNDQAMTAESGSPKLVMLKARFPVLIFGSDGQVLNSNRYWQAIQADLGGSIFELRAALVSLFNEKMAELGEDENTASYEVPVHLQDIMSPSYNTILVSRLDDVNGNGAEGLAVALLNTTTNQHDPHFRNAWESMRFLSRQDQMFTVYHWTVSEKDGKRIFSATENFVHEKRTRPTHQVSIPFEEISENLTIYNFNEFQKFMTGLLGTRDKGNMIVHLHSVKGYDKYYSVTGHGQSKPGSNLLSEGLAVDITDRVLAKQTEDSRARMNLSQFTMTGLSLEFSNMLTIMEGTLAMLEPDDLASMSREDLLAEVNDLRDQVSRGRKISKAFLNLAEKNMHTSMSEMLGADDINGVRLTDSCCSRLASTLDSISPGIEIEFIKGVTERTVLPMTEVQFTGAVLSLVSNSFDAIKEREKSEDNSYRPLLSIKVETADKNPFLPASERKKLPDGEAIFILTVEDNGVGMDSLVQEKAVQPYFTTKTGTNIGMGLTTLQQLTSSYLGNIDIKSRPGKGAKVAFWLPIKAEQ